MALLICRFVVLASLSQVQGEPAGKQQPERFWTELGNSDAMAAFKVMGEMIMQPKETVDLLATKLQPVAAADAEAIEKLVKDLDSDTFAVRQKSTKELEKLGGQARPALEKVLLKPPSAEAQSRAKKLLEMLDGSITSPDELRMIRAIEVLERIATPEAKELLARLAKGAPAALQTEEAERSLKRMK